MLVLLRALLELSVVAPLIVFDDGEHELLIGAVTFVGQCLHMGSQLRRERDVLDVGFRELLSDSDELSSQVHSHQEFVEEVLVILK